MFEKSNQIILWVIFIPLIIMFIMINEIEAGIKTNIFYFLTIDKFIFFIFYGMLFSLFNNNWISIIERSDIFTRYQNRNKWIQHVFLTILKENILSTFIIAIAILLCCSTFHIKIVFETRYILYLIIIFQYATLIKLIILISFLCFRNTQLSISLAVIFNILMLLISRKMYFSYITSISTYVISISAMIAIVFILSMIISVVVDKQDIYINKNVRFINND